MNVQMDIQGLEEQIQRQTGVYWKFKNMHFMCQYKGVIIAWETNITYGPDNDNERTVTIQGQSSGDELDRIYGINIQGEYAMDFIQCAIDIMGDVPDSCSPLSKCSKSGDGDECRNCPQSGECFTDGCAPDPNI